MQIEKELLNWLFYLLIFQMSPDFLSASLLSHPLIPLPLGGGSPTHSHLTIVVAQYTGTLSLHRNKGLPLMADKAILC